MAPIRLTFVSNFSISNHYGKVVAWTRNLNEKNKGPIKTEHRVMVPVRDTPSHQGIKFA